MSVVASSGTAVWGNHDVFTHGMSLIQSVPEGLPQPERAEARGPVGHIFSQPPDTGTRVTHPMWGHQDVFTHGMSLIQSVPEGLPQPERAEARGPVGHSFSQPPATGSRMTHPSHRHHRPHHSPPPPSPSPPPPSPSPPPPSPKHVRSRTISHGRVHRRNVASAGHHQPGSGQDETEHHFLSRTRRRDPGRPA